MIITPTPDECQQIDQMILLGIFPSQNKPQLNLVHILRDIGYHDDVIKWKLFRVIDPLCGEFTGHWWIPSQRASNTDFDESPPKMLIKMSNDRWFEITWRSCDVMVMSYRHFWRIHARRWSALMHVHRALQEDRMSLAGEPPDCRTVTIKLIIATADTNDILKGNDALQRGKSDVRWNPRTL